MLNYNQVIELVEALEKCNALIDSEIRKTIVRSLPPDWLGTLLEAPTLRSHITNIVLKCSEYPGGIDVLIRLVKFQEGSTLNMTEVERIGTKISTIPTEKPRPRPTAVDPDTN